MRLPKMHERLAKVTAAHTEISKAVIDAVKKHELTYAELSAILATEISSWAKYEIREERHGNTEKPGGLA